MKKQVMENFFSGLVIAFTISILILATVTEVATDTSVVPVSLIWQAFALSILCSLINLVYRSEKLKFIWQSVISYILTTTTIITCGLIFDWYGYGDNGFEKIRAIITSFVLYTVVYLLAWIVAWKTANAKKRELNDKLKEYKQKQ